MTSVMMKKMNPSVTMKTKLLVTSSHSNGDRILSNFPEDKKKRDLTILSKSFKIVLEKVSCFSESKFSLYY